jgi:hypothetical protein
MSDDSIETAVPGALDSGDDAPQGVNPALPRVTKTQREAYEKSRKRILARQQAAKAAKAKKPTKKSPKSAIRAVDPDSSTKFMSLEQYQRLVTKNPLDTPLARVVAANVDTRNIPAPFGPLRRKVFLQMLAEYPSVTHAAAAVGVETVTVYRHKRNDPQFSVAFDDAVTAGMSLLETEAIRRATQGIEEKVYYKGEVIDTKRTYSDGLLMFVLKGRMRETYGDKRELTGKDGAPIQVDSRNIILNAESMSPDARAAMRVVLEEAMGGDGEIDLGSQDFDGAVPRETEAEYDEDEDEDDYGQG